MKFVAYTINAMNILSRDGVPKITMSFLDNTTIKVCLEEEKGESKEYNRCMYFVLDHIMDCVKGNNVIFFSFNNHIRLSISNLVYYS